MFDPPFRFCATPRIRLDFTINSIMATGYPPRPKGSRFPWAPGYFDRRQQWDAMISETARIQNNKKQIAGRGRCQSSHARRDEINRLRRHSQFDPKIAEVFLSIP